MASNLPRPAHRTHQSTLGSRTHMLLGCIVVLGLSACEPTATMTTTKTADATESIVLDVTASAAAATDAAAVLLDVRTPEEFAAGHIDGAVNINIAAPDFAAQVGKLDKDATYLVHCSKNVENGRSAQALAIMAQLGFTELRNVVGGYAALNELADPG